MARPVARSAFVQPKQINPSVYFQAVRCYAASAGLSQDEVTGRIMDLLKNFDKVMGMRSNFRPWLTLQQVNDASKVAIHCA